MVVNIMKELKFALYAIKKNIKKRTEIRTSFLMNVFGMAINNLSFVVIWIFFIKTVGIIGGWQTADIIGLQGFISFSFGIIFSFGAGIRKLPDYVASGAFDKFMLSPKNLLLRIATSWLGVSSLGDLVFGTVSLTIYGFLIHMTLYQLLLSIILIIITTFIFISVITIISSVAFLFTDATYLTGGLFDLFLTPALFHGGAFQGPMRFIFTFIIPSLLVGTIPVEIVRSLSLKTLLMLAILAIIWFILSIKIFYTVIKKYESSNFMTFGN